MNAHNRAFGATERPLFASVEPSTLALHNRLQRRRPAVLGQLNGMAITLTCAVPAPQLTAECFSLGISGAALHGRLRLPPALLERLLANQGVAAVFHGLLPTAQAILLEQALLPLLEPLEALLEQPLQLTVRSETPPLPLGFGMAVRLGDDPAHTLAVELNVAAAQRLADVLDRHLPSQPQALPGLLFSLALHAGWQTLSLSELRSLQPGDVLMLEVPGAGELRLALAANRWARAQRQGQGIRLIEALNCVEPITEYSMSQETLEPGVEAALGDVPLTVVCQVGSLQVSLAELQQLGEGSVLALPEAGNGVVELLVNGRSVGRGELVKLGDGLGVRLTRFASL